MKRPYVTIKFAETLDGKIAALDGSSKWISSPKAREFVHKLRAQNSAILVGVNTVIKDDPILNARLVKGKSPIRIVIDGKLRIPINSKLVKTANDARTIIVTTPETKRQKKLERLKSRGVEFIILPKSKAGGIDLRDIIRILYKKGIKSLLVEGGKRVITSFLKAKLADKIVVVISPKILGEGVDCIGALNIKNIKRAMKLKLENAKKVGDDIIYTARLRRSH